MFCATILEIHRITYVEFVKSTLQGSGLCNGAICIVQLVDILNMNLFEAVFNATGQLKFTP